MMSGSNSKFNVIESKKKLSKNHIFIVRHAERIDHIQKKWYKNCFNEIGIYKRNDLNLPPMIPDRINSPLSFKKDSPITCMGRLHAMQLGIQMANNKEKIVLAYASPALRSVETCSHILEGLGIRESVKINIEPSLFEWLNWYKKLPRFMTMEELDAAGHNVNKDYKQVIPIDRLEDRSKESMEQFYGRSYEFMRVAENIICNEISGSTLIVGHSPTIEVCTRQLLGHDIPTKEVFEEAYGRVKYCEWKHLVNDGGEWHLAKDKNLPLTTSERGRYFRFINQYST